MRLLDIDIYFYDRIEAELKGKDNVNDERSVGVIDLDTVTSVWENGDKHICIHLLGGESYLTDSYRLSEFKDLWRGTTPGREAKCPCCSTNDVVVLEDSIKCHSCGYVGKLI